MAVENQDYSNILESRNHLFKSSSSLDFIELNALHDEIINQTIKMAFNKTIQAYGPPPSPFCFFIMGSGGRKEQGVWSDQDHGIIYQHNHPDTRNYFLLLGKEISAGLKETGYKLCDGNVMASNPFWCRSLQEWQTQLNEWIEDASWESIRHLLTFMDSRSFLGEEQFIHQLKHSSYHLINKKKLFNRILENTMHIKKSIGVLGQLLVEPHGPYSGHLNIKESAIYPYVNAGRLLAIYQKLYTTSTIDRFNELSDLVMQRHLREKYAAQFSKLQYYRLAYGRHENYESGHYLDVDKLTKDQKKHLKEIIKDGVQLNDYVKKLLAKGENNGDE